MASRNFGLLAGIGLLCVLLAVVGYVSLDRIRGPVYVDNALRRDTVTPYTTANAPEVSGAVTVASAQPVTGDTVRLAFEAPAGSQAVQVSQHPEFLEAEWQPLEPELDVPVDNAGYQTLFVRFLLDDNATSGISVAGVEVDPGYEAATASAEGVHVPTWIRPFSPTELVVRIEAGRLSRGALEPYDLNNPQSGDDVSEQGGLLTVERDGQTYGFQVSQRTDVIRRADRLIGRPIEGDLASEQWTITSDDDPNYSQGSSATGARHIARPAGLGTGEDGDRLAEVTHDVVLSLPAPLEAGMTYTIAPGGDIAPSTFTYDPDVNLSPAVRVNQVGFEPGDTLKVGYLSGWFDGIGDSALAQSGQPAFSVVDISTGDVVLRGTGTARPSGNELDKGDLTGSPVFELDFSDVDRTGRFRLCVENIGCSYDFAINDVVWDGLTADVARALYHQRSGTELGPPYTPIQRPRPYHPDDGSVVQASGYTLLQAQTDTTNTNFEVLAELGTSEIVDGAWGGHFDAGDWDRRINHLWYVRTAAQLVAAFPEQYGSLELNIPESGDNTPDLLDEALWSLDLYRRMQLPDGAIRGGIETSEHPPPNSTSWVDDLAVFAYEPDPFSSYVYAGAAAEMAAVLRSYDEGRSEELLDSALAAMTWADAQSAPASGAEMVAAQRNVAAAALLLATGDEQWHDLFVETAVFLSTNDPFMACHAHNRCDAAWLYLQTDEAVTDPAIRQDLQDRFVASADATLAAADTTAYGWTTENPFTPLIWGLGAGGAPHTSGLMRAHILTDDDRYRDAALRSAGFALGANPLNRSMLTGIGNEPVRSPQINDVKHGGLPAWSGTPVYGNHMLNAIDDDQWVVDDVLTPAGASPDPTGLPYLWQWYDIGSVALFSEFTVHQSHAEALWTFGTLAATS